MAFVTTVQLGKSDLLFTTVGSFFERNLKVVSKIRATLRGRRISPPTAEEFVKNAAAAAKDFAEDLEWIVKTPGAVAPHAGVKGGMAVLIVSRPFLGIAQDFVRFPDLLEALFGSFVTGIFIRMIFQSRFAVSLFDLFLIGCSLNPKGFVVIAFGHIRH
jgi:hypothetical protein